MEKVLIANRGEIACRIIKSCKLEGFKTVAVYSDADSSALHVGLADEKVCIGSGPAKDSYLVKEKIIGAAQKVGADAIHPGYGFLAENSEFARQVEMAGITWIGPRPTTIVDMGDKERARDIASSVGLPVLPGSPRFEVGRLGGLEKAAEEVGYPLLVKASAGGGGIGMKRINSSEQLVETVESTQSLAEKVFGDGTVFLERFIPKARHIEIQVFGFGEGHSVHLYERECSIQRRYQKILEESPAPRLPDHVRMNMAWAASRLTHHTRYASAGTVEFIVDAETFDFFFLEMNTRIQVEHPVTEMNTGVDLVGLQLHLAKGELEPFEQRSVVSAGHSIECRIYAENPDMNFMPSPGILKEFVPPEESEFVRVDNGFQQGDKISFFYDPMIAKIITHASNREDARQHMLAALNDFKISGVKNNICFLRKILSHESFVDGDIHTKFVDDNINELVGA